MKDFMEPYLKNKTPDCILYSEEGTEFKTHKELLGQTRFMRKLLKETANCCGIIEIICPCSEKELSKIVNFLNYGQIHYSKPSESMKFLESIHEVLGFRADPVFWGNFTTCKDDKREAIDIVLDGKIRPLPTNKECVKKCTILQLHIFKGLIFRD